MLPEVDMAGLSGQEVRQKIESTGVPLAEVARRLRISPQSLQKRFAVDDIKVGVLRELAKAINKSVYFFFDEGSNFNVQSQVNEDRARQNYQNLNLGNQGRISPESFTEIERLLEQGEARLKEKDQIIADLRKTIALYERLINTNPNH